MKRPDSARPLAAAAARLRGKPGRPRKHPQPGHTTDTAAPQVAVDAGAGGGTLASEAYAPRLLDVPGGARYLSVSPWVFRDLVATGQIPRIRIPLPGGGELRKILVDRFALDALIAKWSEAP